MQSYHKWKKLSALAMNHWDYKMAETCLKHMDDLQGLMLLYTTTNNAEGKYLLKRPELRYRVHKRMIRSFVKWMFYTETFCDDVYYFGVNSSGSIS